MSESDDNRKLSDSISRLQPKNDFCLFCQGTGIQRDLIMLTDEPCKHCQGEG